jgi:putative addiction module component (TIGR02574 family)
MPRQPAQILHETLELSPEERAALADSLLESLHETTGVGAMPAWREEIERRIVSIDEGTAKLVPWDDVCARLNRRSRLSTLHPALVLRPYNPFIPAA